ncbi:MAG: Ldh family oxidoreductase, partial [Deltaproteobacteria bacterium]|nr:Ldh family oxidoreductase [Deltaproteobacteria bacterium]
MPTVKASDLEKMVIDILSKAGCEEAEAVLVAKNLVLTNLLGHDSHGVGMVPLYVQNIHDGFLKPNVPVRLIKEDGSILIFDGRQGFGQRVAFEAMEAA